jgi:hypothetical protein
MPTNVYVQNELPVSVTVDTSVTPALSDKYWSNPSGPVSAPPGPPVEICWMDRDIGITNGDTWVFTSAASVGGSPVQMQEQVTGTAVSSSIAIQVTAADRSTGWQDEGAALTFTAADNNTYQVVGKFVSASTYDNVIYTAIKL